MSAVNFLSQAAASHLASPSKKRKKTEVESLLASLPTKLKEFSSTTCKDHSNALKLRNRVVSREASLPDEICKHINESKAKIRDILLSDVGGILQTVHLNILGTDYDYMITGSAGFVIQHKDDFGIRNGIYVKAHPNTNLQNGPKTEELLEGEIVLTESHNTKLSEAFAALKKLVKSW